MDASSPAFPAAIAMDGSQGIKYGPAGMSARMYCAVEILKGLVTAAPYQVLPREDLVNEAYHYADLLMERQWRIPT